MNFIVMFFPRVWSRYHCQRCLDSRGHSNTTLMQGDDGAFFAIIKLSETINYAVSSGY